MMEEIVFTSALHAVLFLIYFEKIASACDLGFTNIEHDFYCSWSFEMFCFKHYLNGHLITFKASAEENRATSPVRRLPKYMNSSKKFG